MGADHYPTMTRYIVRQGGPAAARFDDGFTRFESKFATNQFHFGLLRGCTDLP